MRQDTEYTKGILLFLTSVSIWFLGSFFIRKLSLDTAPLCFWLSFFNTITLAAIIKPRKVSFDKNTNVASIAYACMLFFFIDTIQQSSYEKAVLLRSFSPIYVAFFLLIFFQKKISRLDTGSIVIYFLGIFFLFSDDLQSSIVSAGGRSAIMAGLSFAIFTLFTETKKKEKIGESVFLGSALSLVIFCIITFLDSYSNPKGVLHQDVYFGFAINTEDSILVAFLGVLYLAIPYLLYIRGIFYTSAFESSLICIFELFLLYIWKTCFTETSVPWSSLIGGCIITVYVIGQSLWKRYKLSLFQPLS